MVGCVPVACKYEVLEGIFVDGSVDVGVNVVAFGGVVAGHVDSEDVGIVVDGLVGNVSC